MYLRAITQLASDKICGIEIERLIREDAFDLTRSEPHRERNRIVTTLSQNTKSPGTRNVQKA